MQIPVTALCWRLTIAMILLAMSAGVAAQTVHAYPMKGQSGDVVRKDEAECQMWAMERTGFNPRVGPPPLSGAPSASDYAANSSGGSGFGSGEGVGGVVADGARGGAIGALGGLIAGDASKGAAWGALGGAILGGAKRNRREEKEAEMQRQQQMQIQQQQQQQLAQYEQGRRNFDGAYGLCMEARDYQVTY